jgi:LacI family transcriptional regulator
MHQAGISLPMRSIAGMIVSIISITGLVPADDRNSPLAKSRRTTLEDVARAAGVGVATVDRVLNARARVAPETAARVVAAAEATGYHGKAMLKWRIAEMAPACRFGFLLQKEGKWEYQTLAEELRIATLARRDVRAEPVFSFVGSLSAERLAEEITRLGADVDALAVVSVDHPAISEAVDTCAARGVAVYALLSPLGAKGLAGYVGQDGYIAGRTAGWAMTRLARPGGDIGVLVGSHRYLGQQANERGFRDAMARHAPDRVLRETLIYLDDEAIALEAAQDLLARLGKLAGIYHSGGGVGGVARALKASGRAGEITYICHTRSPGSEAALREGIADLVISGSLAGLARTLTDSMADSVRTGKPVPPPAPERFELLTIENL